MAASTTIGQLRVIFAAYTGEFVDGTKKALTELDRFGAGVERIGRMSAMAGAGLTKTLTVPLLTAAGTALKFGGDFEAAMNRVGASVRASGSEMATLRGSVDDVSRAAGTALSETVRAFEGLADEGLSLQQIVGGAGESAAMLSRALGGDVTASARTAAAAVKSFTENAGDMERATDQIVGTVSVAGIGVAEYAAALEGSGRMVSDLGGSFADFNTALAATAPAFESASAAATGYRNFLARLAPTSTRAKEQIRALGLEFFDAAGNMRPLAEISEELRQKLSHLNAEAQQEVLQRIFGQEGMRTALALMTQGADGISRLREQIAGYSAEAQSAARNRGFNEQLKQFRDEVQRLAIVIAESGLLEAMAELLSRITALMRRVTEANPELLRNVVVWGSVAAAIGPALLVIGGVTAAIGRMLVALRAVPASAMAAATGMRAFANSGVGALGIVLALSPAVAQLSHNLVRNSEFGKRAGDEIARLALVMKFGLDRLDEINERIDAIQRGRREAPFRDRFDAMAQNLDKLLEDEDRRAKLKELEDLAANAQREIGRLIGGESLTDTRSADELQRLLDRIYPLQAALREYEKDLKAAQAAGVPLADATSSLARIAYDAAGGYEELKDRLDELPEPLRRLLEADRAVADLKVARSAMRLQREVRSLDRQIFSLARGGLSELDSALAGVDMQYESTRERIEGLIETNRALAAESPAAAAALAALEGQLIDLEGAYVSATEATREQIEAQNRLRDAAAAMAGEDIRREIEDLRRARGDRAPVGERERQLERIERGLQQQRERALFRLMELEAQRDAAARQNDEAEVARLDHLIGLQKELYEETLNTTSVQIETAEQIQRVFDRLTDDLSSSLADMLMEWKFDLNSLRRVFAELARDEFMKPFLKDAMSGLGDFVKGIFGGAQGGGGGAGGGGFLSSIGGFFKSFGGFFAEGGRLAPGQWGIVGEDGPELARAGPSGLDISPASGMAGGVTMIINTPNADSFRRSERQITQGYRRALGLEG